MNNINAYVLEVLLYEARKNQDSKVGTGKKPKGSSRRLYTDETLKIL